MKRCFIQMVTIVLLCILVLSSCENNTSETLSVEFNDHLKKYYQVTENATQQVAFSSENLVFRESDLEIEKVEYGTYHIIVTMGDMLNPRDQVWKISADELKEEMNSFAEAFIDFAKIKDMDNDYYLYIEIYDGLVCFVYDYEEDVLFLPEKYELYCEMYSTFGMTRENKIAETESGVDWLVRNGFGEIKHNEYESITDLSDPLVNINDDGEFVSYNLNWQYSR